MKKHWYKIFIHYCPVCGKEDVFRERVYGKKPVQTHFMTIMYDGCII